MGLINRKEKDLERPSPLAKDSFRGYPRMRDHTGGGGMLPFKVLRDLLRVKLGVPERKVQGVFSGLRVKSVEGNRADSKGGEFAEG